MKGLISILIVCVLTSFLVSCSSKSNAILTNILERTIQHFEQPMLLFSTYEIGDYLKDIDLATLVLGNGFHDTPGDICHEIPWNDDYDTTFTAGVSIRETEINDEKYRIPWYSWLVAQDGDYGYTGAEGMAVLPEGEELRHHNNPKCDAIYFRDSSPPYGIVELAVCYEMVYDNIYMFEFNKIGVTINTWDSDECELPMVIPPDQSKHFIIDIDLEDY